MKLLEEITTAINRSSAENGSDTPDFILGQYLLDCLESFNKAMVAREKWYGREVGGLAIPIEPTGLTTVKYPCDCKPPHEKCVKCL
jgi:hypothetical protein